MRVEDEGLQAMYLREHGKAEELRMESETKELREFKIEERWKKYTIESAFERELQIQ